MAGMIGAKRFEEQFLVVEMPPTRCVVRRRSLGNICMQDCDYTNRPCFRPINLPAGEVETRIILARPIDVHLSLAECLALAAEFGYRPSTHSEVETSIARGRDLIPQIYELVDKVMKFLERKRGCSLANVISPATFVRGSQGELTPVLEVAFEGGNHRQALRLIDPKAPLFLGQFVGLSALN